MARKPGPPPKPTKLKLVQGNPGKRKISKKEPKPKAKAKPPAWLKKDVLAFHEWNRLAPALEAVGLLTSLDVLPFAQYCDSVSLYQRARTCVLRDGALIKSDKGGQYYNPNLAIMRRERDYIKVAAAMFGLSPSDRTRIDVPEDGERGALASELMDF